MLKRILIPLDDSKYTKTATQLGLVIAKQLDAEITGLVVLDLAGIEKSIGPIPLGGLHYAEQLEEMRTAEAKEYVEKLLSEFREKCSTAGIKFTEAEDQGSPSERILQESLFYDAVIIGMRTHYKFSTEGSASDSLESLLDHSITPIYAVPEKYEIPKIPSEKVKVLIAFDGSLPAAKAVQRFAQLAFPEFMEITLLNSNDDSKRGNYLLNHAETYLNSHSFTNIKKEFTHDHIIETIENKYIDNVDLLVTGAHSKKGILDFMLGSLTKKLIKINKKPVLIGQ